MILVDLGPVIILAVRSHLGHRLFYVEGRPVAGILIILGVHLDVGSRHIVDKGCRRQYLIAEVLIPLKLACGRVLFPLHVGRILNVVGGKPSLISILVAVTVDLAQQLHDAPLVLARFIFL